MIKDFAGKKYRIAASPIRGTCRGCDIDKLITTKPELHIRATLEICGSCTYGATQDQIFKELADVPSATKGV